MRDRPRRPHIEPEAAIRAALEILDAEGLEHVTLSRIATKLGVQAPALYWHFKDKQDIVDDMAQAMLRDGGIDEISFPEDVGSWAEWLTNEARSVRKALLSHREGGRVVAGASLFRARALANGAIVTIRVLNEAGFDLLHATLATSTVFDYVWGYVIEEQAKPPQIELASQSAGEDVPSSSNTELQMGLMGAMVKEMDKLTEEQKFDWGLQLIITGLKSELRKAKGHVRH